MSTSDDWYRRYEANQKVPHLPADDYDFDRALSEIRAAVGEIAPDAVAGITSVLRILRHRRTLAAQVLDKHEPTCLGCGGDRKCLGCDDVRHEAEALSPGWRFVSPLNRWETVTRTEQANEYAPVRVWTNLTGQGYSWLITRWQKVDAVAPPPRTLHGTPEIRVFEHDYARDAPMYAVPTLDTVHRPDTSEHLVEARYSRERGWAVSHRPNGGELITVWCDSKAKARTALRAAAREHAKALGVKVVIQPTTATAVRS